MWTWNAGLWTWTQASELGPSAQDLEPGSTTADLEIMIRKKGAGALDGITLLAAVNKHYVSEPVPLEDGDEVAFIPPVQGG